MRIFLARLAGPVFQGRLVFSAFERGGANRQNGGPVRGRAGYSDRVTAVARMAANLMRSEGGPEIAVIEAGGWDTHANQGGAQRKFSAHAWPASTRR